MHVVPLRIGGKVLTGSKETGGDEFTRHSVGHVRSVTIVKNIEGRMPMKKVTQFELDDHEEITLYIPYGDNTDTPFIISMYGNTIDCVEKMTADGTKTEFTIYDKEDMEVAECIRKWLDKNLPMNKVIEEAG